MASGMPLQISVEKFPPIVMPGRIIGNLRDDVAAEIGLSAIPVVAVAGHDTASAVAAVPASGRNFAYLSSGTWSLMGIESEKPIVTDEAYRMNFTNEGGIDGTTRFLKNITGLWLLEQCLKVWKNKSGVTYSYPQIVEMAQSVATNESYVNPDDATFFQSRFHAGGYCGLLQVSSHGRTANACRVCAVHIRQSCFEVSLCFDPLADGGIFSHRMSAYYRRRFAKRFVEPFYGKCYRTSCDCRAFRGDGFG